LHRALEGNVEALKDNPVEARASYDAGVKAGDFSRAHATVGEAVGLIRDIPSAEALVSRLFSEATQALKRVTG
jgi:nitronate monooxygenase